MVEFMLCKHVVPVRFRLFPNKKSKQKSNTKNNKIIKLKQKIKTKSNIKNNKIIKIFKQKTKTKNKKIIKIFNKVTKI